VKGKCDGCGRIGTVVLIPMEGIYCPLCEAIILGSMSGERGRDERL